MLTEPLAVTLQVIDVLDALEIPYFIGGSLAVAMYGLPRSTMDSDLVADMNPEQVEPLVQALCDTFYANAEMILDAIQHRGSFNLIHLETMFKVDIFLPKRRSFDQAQFERRKLQTLSMEPERSAYVASPEDSILSKLEWYHMGGEVSDRQWQDVQNVLKVQGERLDLTYLRRWAEQLGVSDLLERAFQQAQ